MSFALVFPGQGSQSVGMLAELADAHPLIKDTFQEASDALGYDLWQLIQDGPEDELGKTHITQPAMLAGGVAVWRALQSQTDVMPAIMAGHSLGEYSALSAAGTVSAQDTIRLVYKRGELMHRESTRYEGAMHAIVGLPIAEVDNLVAEIQPQGVVSVANHNSELQIVITGSPEPVEKVSELAAQKGAKSIPLKVSGAWHSELIKGAEQEFKAFLAQVGFNPPEKSIILNVTADISADADEIKDIMGRQLCSPVKWYDCMVKLIDDKMETFVEVGPGRVLTGLLKKTLPPDYPAKVYNISNMKQLERFMNENA